MSELNYRNFSAFAFDFDGTIADATALHHSARLKAFQTMYEATGDVRYKDVPSEIHNEAHRHGSSPITIIGWTLKQAGIVSLDSDLHSDPVVATVVAEKNAAYDTLVTEGAPEIAGATDFIKRLHSVMAGRLAIVTTARLEQEVTPFLKRYDLKGIFTPEKIVSRVDVPSHRLKPFPDAYEIALQKFDLSDNPKQMLAIEDSFHGIESATRAGVAVVALAKAHTIEEFEAADRLQKPVAVAESYSQLLRTIRL